jgi:hypothetical protein
MEAVNPSIALIRSAALTQMKEEIVRLNGTDRGCSCLRRCRANANCYCGKNMHNGACLNVECDMYYMSEIVKCDKGCDKWMLSVYTLV